MLTITITPCRDSVSDLELTYASDGAAGFDLFAAIDRSVILKRFERAVIPTGFKMEIPTGYEGQIRSRSGLTARSGIVVLNSPGTIDSDYRGEVGVVICNFGESDAVIEPLMRIAQMVIAPVLRAEFKRSASLTPTKRGEGGFGSTGSKPQNSRKRKSATTLSALPTARGAGGFGSTKVASSKDKVKKKNPTSRRNKK